MTDWQPTETAPKTVPPTRILVSGGELDEVAIVWWVDRYQAWGNNWRAPFPYEFDFWMPVPEKMPRTR